LIKDQSKSIVHQDPTKKRFLIKVEMCKFLKLNCKKINTLQQDKCKCKKFGRVSVNDAQHWFVGLAY
jgi:hypothetical protein